MRLNNVRCEVHFTILEDRLKNGFNHHPKDWSLKTGVINDIFILCLKTFVILKFVRLMPVFYPLRFSKVALYIDVLKSLFSTFHDLKLAGYKNSKTYYSLVSIYRIFNYMPWCIQPSFRIGKTFCKLIRIEFFEKEVNIYLAE